MTIRDSTQIPDYVKIFDPQQFEMEQHIAKLLKNNVSADIDIQRVLARVVVKVVLGEFRPDMFEDYRLPELCRGCGGCTQDELGNPCPTCKGSGMHDG